MRDGGQGCVWEKAIRAEGVDGWVAGLDMAMLRAIWVSLLIVESR
jgi:hypothetical protein